MRRSRFPMFMSLGVMIFLYAPIIVLVIYSFNDSRYPGAWQGFTLKWYSQLMHATSVEAKDIWRATTNPLIVAFCAPLVSMVFGPMSRPCRPSGISPSTTRGATPATMAAGALYRFKSKIQRVHHLMVYAPLVVPDILMGISMLMLFVNINVRLGLTTIIIAHTTFCISYVALVVLGRLQDFDHTLVDAARDLGADGLKVCTKVLLPLLGPGIAAGGLLAFTLSIDDFVVTFFTAGPGSTTLPVQVYSMMRHGTPSLINALSVIFIIITFSVVIFSQRLLLKRNESHTH